MQKDNKLLDDLARMATGAAGSVLEMKREMQHMVNEQLEKLLSRMNFATREEYEALHAMIAKFRTEQEEIKKRLEAIEAKIAKK